MGEQRRIKLQNTDRQRIEDILNSQGIEAALTAILAALGLTRFDVTWERKAEDSVKVSLKRVSIFDHCCPVN